MVEYLLTKYATSGGSVVAVGSGDGHMIVLAEDSGAHVTTVRRRTLYRVFI